MLIAIEAERANENQKTGVEHYAKQLILNFAKIDNENQYRLYLRTKPQDWFLELPKNFEIKVMPFPKFWTQIRLSIELFFHPVDRLFIPASALPIFHPRKSVCTIHDTAFIHYPEADTTFMRKFLHYSYKMISKLSWRVICISESTKNDLIKYYGTKKDKIFVVHHGYDKQVTNQNFSATTLKLPDKYALFLSTLQPRKNLIRLINSFRKFTEKHPEENYKLVVVGKKGWKYEPIIEAIEKNKDLVIYLGHITDEEREWVYKNAQALVMPSLYEGFGMWILEAFSAKIPVAVSDVSSLPEIAGEGAVYFNPENEESILEGIEKVLLDNNLREELVKKGSERLSQFSWEKTAKQTLEVILGNENK